MSVLLCGAGLCLPTVVQIKQLEAADHRF